MTKPLKCDRSRCSDFYVKYASYGTCGRDGETVRRFNYCRFGRHKLENPPEFMQGLKAEELSSSKEPQSNNSRVIRKQCYDTLQPLECREQGATQ